MAVSERWLVRALALYALFFVYGSLVPLQWRGMPWGAAWQDFLSLPGPTFGIDDRVDSAVNFLLTLPLAFGLSHLARWWRAGLALRVSLTRFVALVWVMASLSLAVEFAQMFFPPRTPSWSDVVAQCAGSLTGFALYMLFGARFARALHGLGQQQPARDQVQRWLVVWLAGLLLFSVMPLDLSLSPVEIYRKWRDGRVILWPLASTALWGHERIYELLTDILLWVPVGALWRMGARQRSVRGVVWRALLAAALIEFLQLFVMSRVSDATDLLTATLGAGAGALLPRAVSGLRRAPAAARQRALYLLTGVWVVVAVWLLWGPFEFERASISAASIGEAFLRTPFLTYASRSEFGALNEILRKLLVFLPGGLLLGAFAAVAGRAVPARWPWVAFGVFVFLLELGQVGLPGRVADLTDAVLGCLGGWLGWKIARTVGTDAAGGRPDPLAGPAASTPKRPSAALAAPRPLRHFVGWNGVAILVFAVLIWLAGRLPGLPYNIPKLMPAGPAGVVAALGLATTLWWMLAAPMWVLWPQRRAWRVFFVPLGLVHGLLTFALLRAAVPLPMIHKVIGSPVLGWGGPWEEIGRFLALHLSLAMPVFGAMLLVQVPWRPAALAGFVSWVVAALMLAWPLHWLVVESAATDNLVELMRGGGGLGTSTALAAGIGLIAAAGSAVSLALAQTQRRGPLLGLALLALLVAPGLLWSGLEPTVVKYDRVFSAWQFLFSASRQNYATGTGLWLRAALAMAAVVTAVAVLQYPMWRMLAVRYRPERPHPGPAA